MTLHRPITAVAAMTAAVVPLSALAAPAIAASATKSYTGASGTTQWGAVRVTIKVKGRKIVAVTATAPSGDAKTKFINQGAVPVLRREALKAQSASINAVSGATQTSSAFVKSLKSALKRANV
jgi:uncharacterized protein with FMN-binding domain